MDDGAKHHVADLDAAVGLGREVVARYLNKLIRDGPGRGDSTAAGPQARYRRI
jgi:hypothetical protein